MLFVGGIILIIIGLFTGVIAWFAAESDMSIVFYASLILFIIGVVGGLFLICDSSRNPDTPEQMLEMKLKAVEDAQKDLQKFYTDYPEFKNENQ